MPTIHVSETVKEDLDAIKDGEGHSSYDSVVRSLLYEADRRPDGGEPDGE